MTTQELVYDVLGVGFGPSNLALAIAVYEHNQQQAAGSRPLSAVFLEKQETFGWHRGMLLEDATMQVSFFKDLVTLRNPTSDFSFVCYLKARDRLIEFINHKTLFPLRAEFHDYFTWVADRLDDLVDYGSEVIAIEPVEVHGEIAWFDVVSRDREQELVVRRARNVVVATGLEPLLPAGLPQSERIWHNSELVPRVEQLRATPPRRVVVVGAGQSAAESVAHLHRSFPEAEVCAVFGKYGYTPADDSPYANRIFDPEAVDVFFGAPPEVKQSLMAYHRSTNYSVVDLDLIEELYRQEYQELVQGRRRLRIMNASAVRRVEVGVDDLAVSIESLPTGEVATWDVDALVYATGYRPSDPGVLLGEAAKLSLRDEQGRLRVGRDYRIECADHVSAGIYVQGATEHVHGISVTLLSNTAVRAGELLDSILAHSRADRQASRSLALAGDHQ